ncbi:DDE superfamily endonuclease [Micromonospora marina]|uniref:DDE superfamily endonuclease n=1 Tax=Micromonospora marina TaxID=307120 RepID=A0A1C5A9B0_9ACTN|nr:DDE superfamily endonuclease [Micromonospora marina]
MILDNLSAHKSKKIRAWAARNKVELCFTPTYASWANPIEAQFGPLRTFVIAGSNHPNHPAPARKLQDYLRWRNANARHPTSWPPNAANAPASASASASAANDNDAGANPPPAQPDPTLQTSVVTALASAVTTNVHGVG